MTTRWRGRIAGVLAAASFLVPAAALARIAVTDDRGRAVELPRPPARIVSLQPSSTETVCELGACDRLVGVDRFSDWPQRVKGLPQVGGLEDAQLERIVALRPDLVVAGPYARVIDRLEALGIPVLVTEAKDLRDIRRMLRVVAQVLGSPGAEEALWRRMNARIDAAAARVPASLRGKRVYFEVASGPFAAGETSFVGEAMTRLGLRNIVPVALGPFPKLNPEYVVRARPDLLMASERDLALMAQRPGWGRLDALRSARLCSFPDDFFQVFLRPGPRIGEAADAMADCLVELERRSR